MATGSLAASLREQLIAVIVALWHDIDHNYGASAASYFTADAWLRFEDATFTGTAAIDAVYQSRAARGPRVSRHLASNVHVLDASDTRARALSQLLLFAEDGEVPSAKTSPSLVADVWDEFQLCDGIWLLRSRWIKNIFLGSASDLAVPVK